MYSDMYACRATMSEGNHSGSDSKQVAEVRVVGQFQHVVVSLQVCMWEGVPKLSLRLQYSRIVMEPLVSLTPRTSISLALRSYEHSKEGGRLT